MSVGSLDEYAALLVPIPLLIEEVPLFHLSVCACYAGHDLEDAPGSAPVCPVLTQDVPLQPLDTLLEHWVPGEPLVGDVQAGVWPRLSVEVHEVPTRGKVVIYPCLTIPIYWRGVDSDHLGCSSLHQFIVEGLHCLLGLLVGPGISIKG